MMLMLALAALGGFAVGALTALIGVELSVKQCPACEAASMRRQQFIASAVSAFLRTLLRERARCDEGWGWEHLATGVGAALGELTEVLGELVPLLAGATAGLVGVVGGVGLGLGLLVVGLRGLG